MSIKKRKVRIIGPSDPDYLETFYKHWGAGQSITSRQAVARLEKVPEQQGSQEPEQEPAPSESYQEGRDSSAED
jgi:hypothetical protein